MKNITVIITSTASKTVIIIIVVVLDPLDFSLCPVGVVVGIRDIPSLVETAET